MLPEYPQNESFSRLGRLVQLCQFGHPGHQSKKQTLDVNVPNNGAGKTKDSVDNRQAGGVVIWGITEHWAKLDKIS